MRHRVERRRGIAQDSGFSSDAPGRGDVGLMQGHEVVEPAKVTQRQVRRFVSGDVVGWRGDEDRDDSGVARFAGQLAEVLLVTRQRHAVRTVRPPCGQVHSKAQPGLDDATVPERAQESPRAGDFRIGQPVRHPVVVPAVVDRHDPRMQRYHVSPELQKSLLRRPAADAELDPAPECGTSGTQLFQRLRGIAPELGARVSHEDDSRGFASSGSQGRLIVARHPQQIRIGLIDIVDRLRIGPPELETRNDVEMKSAHPERQLSDHERHRHARQCPSELRPPGEGGRSWSHQNRV